MEAGNTTSARALSALTTALRTLTATDDPVRDARQVLHLIVDLVPCLAAGIWISTDGGESLTTVATWEREQLAGLHTSGALAWSQAKRALRGQAPWSRVVWDEGLHPGPPRVLRGTHSVDGFSTLSLPLAHDDTPLGVVVLIGPHDDEPAPQTWSAVAEIVAGFGSALQRAEGGRRADFESEIEALHRQLSRAKHYQSLAELSRQLSHRFNNLLQGIMGLASLALEDLPEDSTVRGDIQEIFGSARKGSRLSTSLIGLITSRPAAATATNLNDVVSGVVAELQQQVRIDVNVVSSFDRRPLSVTVDPDLFRQALMALGTRGLESMGEQGTLTVSTAVLEVDPAFAAEHFLPWTGSYAMIEFDDTGQGTTEEMDNRAFDTLFSATEHMEQLGLGLWFAYAVVRSHMGTMTVTSGIGYGTEVHLFLPLDRALEPQEGARTKCSSFCGPDR